MSASSNIAAAILAILIFEYRFFFDHIWSWDLLIVALTFVVIKMSLFTWFRFKD